LGSIHLNSGGMKVLSIGGYRSLIDQNQTLTEHKTKDLSSLWLCTIFSGKVTARYAPISASVERSDLKLFS
jgi:hypothetical protein